MGYIRTNEEYDDKVRSDAGSFPEPAPQIATKPQWIMRKDRLPTEADATPNRDSSNWRANEPGLILARCDAGAARATTVQDFLDTHFLDAWFPIPELPAGAYPAKTK